MAFALADRSARRPLGWHKAALACVVILSAITPGEARADPFEGLAGSWSGGGTLTSSDGTRERIRCRATYTIVDSGVELQQRLRCASDSYRFEVESDVRYNEAAGLISGPWRETTRDVGGTARGPARPGRLSVKVDGAGFAADLEVVTEGNRQTVTINAENADVTEVLVDLRRK